GLSSDVDRILRAGRTSNVSARSLAEAFASAPTPRRPQPESPRPSRRLLLTAMALVVAAAGLVGLGRLFTPSGLPIAPPPAAQQAGGPPAVAHHDGGRPSPDFVDPPALERRHGVVDGDLRPVRRRRRER